MKTTSYQKLKAKNKQLEQDIYSLVKNSDTTEGIMVRKMYELKYEMRDAILFGSRSELIDRAISFWANYKMDGIINFIKNANKNSNEHLGRK